MCDHPVLNICGGGGPVLVGLSFQKPTVSDVTLENFSFLSTRFSLFKEREREIVGKVDILPNLSKGERESPVVRASLVLSTSNQIAGNDASRPRGRVVENLSF